VDREGADPTSPRVGGSLARRAGGRRLGADVRNRVAWLDWLSVSNRSRRSHLPLYRRRQKLAQCYRRHPSCSARRRRHRSVHGRRRARGRRSPRSTHRHRCSIGSRHGVRWTHHPGFDGHYPRRPRKLSALCTAPFDRYSCRPARHCGPCKLGFVSWLTGHRRSLCRCRSRSNSASRAMARPIRDPRLERVGLPCRICRPTARLRAHSTRALCAGCDPGSSRYPCLDHGRYRAHEPRGDDQYGTAPHRPTLRKLCGRERRLSARRRSCRFSYRRHTRDVGRRRPAHGRSTVVARSVRPFPSVPDPATTQSGVIRADGTPDISPGRYRGVPRR
jgi:hypothetical protein